MISGDYVEKFLDVLVERAANAGAQPSARLKQIGRYHNQAHDLADQGNIESALAIGKRIRELADEEIAALDRKWEGREFSLEDIEYLQDLLNYRGLQMFSKTYSPGGLTLERLTQDNLNVN